MTSSKADPRLVVPGLWVAGMVAARQGYPWAAIALVAVVLTAFVLAREPRRLGALLRPSSSTLGMGVAAAAAMLVVTYTAYPWARALAPPLARETAVVYGLFLTGRPLAAVIVFVVPVVVAEEIIWRGGFQDALRTSPTVGVVLAGGVYAAAHLPLGSLLLVGVAFICGVFWSALRAATGSLVPPLVSHLAWDVALVVAPLG